MTDYNRAAERTQPKSQLELVLPLLHEFELIKDHNGNYWVQFKRGKRWRATLLGSAQFQDEIYSLYFERYAEPISNPCMRAIVGILRKRAEEGGNRRVSIRVHRTQDEVYLDFGGQDGKVVKVNASAWEVIDNPGIPFWIAPGMLPIRSEPTPGDGDPEFVVSYFMAVWRLSRVQALLLVAWMVSVLMGTSPYSVLELTGLPGRGRASLARVVKESLDPSASDITQRPKEFRDLIVIANNGHLLVLDGDPALPKNLLDAVCRIAKGAGTARRKMHEDEEVFVTRAQKPQIVITHRPSTNERFRRLRLRIELPPMDDAHKRTEKAVWGEFLEFQPHLLAGLLDVVVCVLANANAAADMQLPGMPDFAELVAAAAPAFGMKPAEALRLYAEHIGEALPDGPDDSPLVRTLVDLVQSQGGWKVTATELLGVLMEFIPDSVPSSPQALGTELSQITSALLEHGIEFRRDRAEDRGRERLLVFEVVGSAAPEVSPAGALDLCPMVDEPVQRSFNPPEPEPERPRRTVAYNGELL